MIDLAIMRAELLRDEDCVLRVYDDATGRILTSGSTVIGHPTIGVGRALDVYGITEAEAAYLLDNDVSMYLHELGGLSWFRNLDSVQQRAIVNMRHQLGLAGLLEFHEMIGALERRDWIGAVAAGRDSVWCREDAPARSERVLALLIPLSPPLLAA